MNLRLVKQDGDYQASADYVDLPSNFIFQSLPFKRTYSMEKKITQSGGVVLGDGTVEPIRLTVRGLYHDSTSVNNWINTITKFVYYNNKFKIYVIDNTADFIAYYDNCYLEDSPRSDIIIYPVNTPKVTDI